MKWLSLLITALFFISCGKEKLDTSTKLEFQLDKNNYTFDSVHTFVDSSGGKILWSIKGVNTKTRSSVDMTGQCTTKDPTGEYRSDYGTSGDHALASFTFIAIIGQSEIYYSQIPGEFSITIDSWDSSLIKGHFLGGLKNSSNNTNSFISKGEFRASYHY